MEGAAKSRGSDCIVHVLLSMDKKISDLVGCKCVHALNQTSVHLLGYFTLRLITRTCMQAHALASFGVM